MSLIGGQTYGLLRNHCSLAKAQLKTYKELTDLLIRHFDPEPLIIAGRFHFHRCNQAPGESVTEFVAELRRLSSTCKFAEAYLNEALQDRFVCGLKTKIFSKGYCWRTSSHSKAADLTLAMEATEKNAKALKAVSDPAIQKLSTSGLPTKRFMLLLRQRIQSSELLFQGSTLSAVWQTM